MNTSTVLAEQATNGRPAAAPPANGYGVVTPAQMLAVAVQQGADLAKLEKLMELQERWEKNQSRKAFDNAISAAKAEIKPITKNRLVDFTSNRGKTNYAYEDFAQVAACVDPALSRHGLSYRFRSKQEGKTLTVVCVISHRDGHSEETSLLAPNDESGNKNAIQSIGSAATYLQRYTLKLALGLAAGLDDDAHGHGRQQPAQPQQPEPEDEGPPDLPPDPKASPAVLRREVGSGVAELAKLKGVPALEVGEKVVGIINRHFKVQRAAVSDFTDAELKYAADSVQIALANARKAAQEAAQEAADAPPTAPLPHPDPHPTIKEPESHVGPAAGLPRNGEELHRRLREADSQLASYGLCPIGALLGHVTSAGCKAGYGADLSKWHGAAIEMAVSETRRFKDGLPKEREPGIDDEGPEPVAVPAAAKAKLPKPVVDTYLSAMADCGLAWERVRPQAKAVIGRALDVHATMAVLSVDEADKFLEWARKLKAASEKAKREQVATADH